MHVASLFAKQLTDWHKNCISTELTAGKRQDNSVHRRRIGNYDAEMLVNLNVKEVPNDNKPFTMKTKNLLKKIYSLAVPLMLILIVAVSCKRKEFDVVPVPPEPTPSATPVVFTNKPIRMMSDHEIANRNDFPGHVLHQVGTGLVGSEGPEPVNPFKEVGETLWEIYDYEHTEHEFQQVNQGLNELINQVSILSSTITSMGEHLNIQIDNLTAYISSGDLNTQIGYVKTAMGSSTEDEFMYYSNTAAAWEADSLNPARIAQMNTLKAYAPTYANSVYHNVSSNSMANIIQAMNEDLCPTLGTGNNALKAYTKTVVSLTNGKINDSTDAMNAYLLVESYFLTVINYQLQAATIMENACNLVDSTGILGYDTVFWNHSVVPQLSEEVNVFLSTVDYLVANIGEYRNQTRFQYDMQYADAGLAPDNLFTHVLARSQFIANLLYDALGLPYPVMCGHILTPSKYPSDPTQVLFVSIGSQSTSAAPTQVLSQLPYTYWNNTTCHPDQTWNAYRYGVMGQYDQQWPTGKQSLVLSSAGGQTPWVHFVPITGSVTPLFYNPKNPSQTSLTQTAECTIEFAYFSACWQWGYLLLSNSSTEFGWKKTSDGGAFDFETFNSGLVGSTMSVPFAATGKNQNLSYQMTGISFTNPNTTTGTMKATGTTGHTSDYYVIVDGNWIGVTTGSDMPALGGTIQGWASYNVTYGMQGSGGVDLTVNIGTTRPAENHYAWTGDEYYTVGGDVVRLNFHDQMNTVNQGFGASQNLQPNTNYQPGVQYYYQTANLSSAVPASITLNQAYQFVYGGYYNLP
jgi:hypothetical protein